MSQDIANAIALGTGLSADDFIVEDHGAGPFLAVWVVGKLGPRPSDAQIESWLATYNADTNRPKREALRQELTPLMNAFTLAQMVGTASAIQAAKAKIDAIKNKYPGIDPG